MSRFRVVNSSSGTYWIEDLQGHHDWLNGIGLTYTANAYNMGCEFADGQEGKDEFEECRKLAEEDADRICDRLNKIANTGRTPSMIVGNLGNQIAQIKELDSSRERSLAITKIQEAMHWLAHGTGLPL